MAKINNKVTYPLEQYPNLDDFLIGSKELGGRTMNFPLVEVLGLFKSSVGINSIQYQFSTGSNPAIDYYTQGAFFTDNNETNPANFSKIILNKLTVSGEDITELFNFFALTDDLVLSFKNPSDPNNFFQFKVINVDDQIDYFVFDVTLLQNNYIGDLQDAAYYNIEWQVYQDLTTKADLSGAIFTGDVTAPKFIVTAGLPNQFLKADGSLDSTVYAIDSNVLHTVGDEDFTGIKSCVNTTSEETNGLHLTNNGVSGSSIVNILNTDTGDGLFAVNISGGNAIHAHNSGSGSGVRSINASSSGSAFYSFVTTIGNGIVSNSASAATGLLYVGQNDDVNTFTVDKFGKITANSFVKAGGLSTQFLKADGTIDSNIYPIDSNVIHTTGNEIKTGTLTVNSIIKAAGLNTQYLMADGSVSTIANVAASQIAATPHIDFLTSSTIQSQLDQTELNLGFGFKNDKTNIKDKYQTGLIRPDIDTSVVTIAPADTLTITNVDRVLFVNEVLPDANSNQADTFVKSFGNRIFVMNATNTLLAANTRGIFYLGIDKLGTPTYRTQKAYDLDICYLARVLIQNSAGVYSILSVKYFPDLAYNEPTERDRKVLASGYLVPSGAASISFGNRAVTFQKNSINYSNTKSDPNLLKITDSVNPTPMSFLFVLPNVTSLAVSIAPSTTINPKNWYLANGTLGGATVSSTSYQVYRLLVTVTGTLLIQTLASTNQNPQLGVNAIFANRDDALAGLTSVVFPDILPAGDSQVLGKFFLRAGTAVNGSQMIDPNDFYFLPVTTSFSSSTVGVTAHDFLSGKNDNPAFQHVTTTDIPNWNGKINFASIISGFVTGANTSVLNTDSLQIAIEKLQGQVNSKQSTLTNPITGAGTQNFVPKFDDATGKHLGNSQFFDNGGIDTGVSNGTYSQLVIKGLLGGDSGGGQILFSNQVKTFASISGETESAGNGMILIRNLTSGSLTEKIRITSNGNVGIGTTSPAEILHLKSSQPVIRFEKAGILNWFAGNISGNSFRVQCDSIGQNLELLPLGGNVLIGTTTDSGNKLDVSGPINISSAGVDSPPASLKYGFFGQSNIGLGMYSQAGGIAFWGGATPTQRMLLAPNGNVSIGTITADYKLNLGGNRPITFDTIQGDIRLNAPTGGWSIGTGFNGSLGTNYDGFRGYGNSDILDYYYIGGSYDNPIFCVKNSSRNVLIGTTTDNGNRLKVVGTRIGGNSIANLQNAGCFNVGDTYSQLVFGNSSSDGQNRLQCMSASSATATSLNINPFGGVVSIGIAGGLSLQVYGNLQYSGTLTNASDKRIKTNIHPLKNSLEKILKTTGYVYDRIDCELKNQIGFIAQEIQNEFPQLVETTDNNYKKYKGLKAVNYTQIIPVLVESIKELNQKFEDYKAAHP